jgi:hypothetical protein
MDQSNNQSVSNKKNSNNEHSNKNLSENNLNSQELDYSFEYEEMEDNRGDMGENIVSESSFDDSLTEEWLSLIHFPDETRVRLTKRGRLFVFQTTTKQSSDILQIIGRTTWNRYKTNLEMSIPLGTIKSLLDNDKDLFVSSFTVLSLGSQKIQLPIQLPIKLPDSPIPKLLALMCLTRHVFNTGIFQTDNPEKAKVFLSLFSDIFGVELPKGENKRGIYIKIPLPLVQSIIRMYTGNENADVPEIIRAITEKHSDREIIEFLNLWFSYSRIYRNLKQTDQILFMFRTNETTNEIVKILTKIGVLWENGSIQEGTRIIPAYIVKNNVENQTILNLSFMDKDPNPKELLEKINKLSVQIKMKDERIDVLENLLGEYSDKLDVEKSNRLEAVYSKYYYEKKTEELHGKYIELQRVKETLETEIKDLNKTYIDYDSRSTQPSDKKLKDHLKTPSIEELEKIAFQKVLEKYEDDPEFDKKVFYNVISNQDSQFRSQKEELNYVVSQGEDETDSHHIKSNLTNPEISKQIIDYFSIIMDRPENWILVGLSMVPLSVEQMEKISELNKLELRQLLTKWENEDIIERIETGAEPVYQFTNLWKKERVRNLKNRLIGRKIPPEIKMKLREILPL